MSGKSPDSLDIPVLFLSGLGSIDFDIYVQVGQRDVLYCRPDDVELSERINRLHAKKGLNFFKVRSDEYAKFLSYIQKDLDRVFMNSSQWTLPEQVLNIFEQQYFLIDQFLHSPSVRELYFLVRTTSGPFYDFFSTQPSALDALYKLKMRQSNHGKMITHMIRVAALSSRLIAETKNDAAGKPIYELILGAMLHDLAYFENPWPNEATPKTSEEYKAHPSRGESIGHKFGHFEPWVVKVLATHEEHIDGSGFPLGLRESDLDPAVLCISCCNAFDRLITLKDMNGAQALKQLLIDKMGALPLQGLQALQKVIKESNIA